jgi:hypothetical protein
MAWVTLIRLDMALLSPISAATVLATDDERLIRAPNLVKALAGIGADSHCIRYWKCGTHVFRGSWSILVSR